ncbi:Non-specific serine threonine protein kinase [Trifolium repens]|nr:Non-specific serine threonine protein kinase [Trifolium repens]
MYEAISYFQQLINVVDYCHSRGVYHQDLEPENLLLDVNGVLKVHIHSLKIKIPEILEDEWVKKGYKPTSFTEEDGINVDDVAATFNDSKENLVTEIKEKPVSMNAFELISRSQSFNLDNLFENQKMKLQGDKSGRKGQLSVATEFWVVYWSCLLPVTY